MTTPEIHDLSVGAVDSVVAPPRRRRPVPPLLGGALGLTLIAGVVGAAILQAADRRRVADDLHLSVVVGTARAMPKAPAGSPVSADAQVSLDLRVSAPARVLDAELDGAPPISRPAVAGALSRNPSVIVRWRVLCAEVGTIPGPRLLDIDFATSSGNQHRRLTLATSDVDPVARVFRLAAAQDCGD